MVNLSSCRVYFDFQILFAQRYGGISRYFYELIPELRALGVQCDISCVHNHNYYFADSFGFHDTSLSEKAVFWFINKFKAHHDTKRTHYDIIHPTYYYMSYGKKSKIVLDIHDMIPEIYHINERLISAKKKTLHEADRIISVSENTKRDLLTIYPDIEPERICVIHHGASMTHRDRIPDMLEFMKSRDYVIFVGNRAGYKNFSRFIEAMKAIMNIHRDLCVLCAGGGEFTHDELDLIRGYESRIIRAGLSDDELVSAYSHALCFVFPSLYEGFGLPVLEAFACDCPVVCSSSSSLPEVAGDAAEYFDGNDCDDIADKITSVIECESLRDDLRRKGRERLKLFDWKKTAIETLKCYEEALS